MEYHASALCSDINFQKQQGRVDYLEKDWGITLVVADDGERYVCHQDAEDVPFWQMRAGQLVEVVTRGKVVRKEKTVEVMRVTPKKKAIRAR